MKSKKKAIIISLFLITVLSLSILSNTKNQKLSNEEEIKGENLENFPKISDFGDELGQYDDGGEAHGIYVLNNIAYVADETDGLEIIDVTDPTNPHELGVFHDGGRPVEVFVSGNIAYVADMDEGLEIINVTDPTNPEELGEYIIGEEYIYDVYVSESIAYVASQILEIVNVTDPTSPEKLGQIDSSSYINGVHVSGNIAYLVDYINGLRIINVTDPTNPEELGVLYNGMGTMDVYVVGNIAYQCYYRGFGIINVTDPTNPEELSYFPFVGTYVFGVMVSGYFAYLACGTDGLVILDVSDPTNFKLIENYDDGGFAHDIYVLNNLAYVADGEDGLEIIDVYPQPPDPPYNLQGFSGYNRINITWDIPIDYGSPIIQYNIYRGDSSGGEKIYIGNSLTNNYTDTTVDYGKWNYYIVRAENLIGESDNSEELRAIAGPFIKWESPEENKLIIFSIGDAIFNFSYDYKYLDNMRLFLNGIDYGSVKGKNSLILTPYSINIDGPVTAVLYGYEEGNPSPIINDVRNFTFTKLTSDVSELLETNSKYIGEKLYSILHDPNGDQSFTSYEESAKISMGVGLETTAGVSGSVKFGEIAHIPFFGVDAGFTEKLELKATEEEGFNFRYEITDTTELMSSQDSSNKDYIGPGYGDRYWGEAWTLKWELKARHRTYFNGTDRYESPALYYGIIRGGEVFLNDYNAPSLWKNQNPVHNGYQNVLWGDNLVIVGGAPYSSTYDVSSTETTSTSTDIEFNSETVLKLPGVEEIITVTLSTKYYAEETVTNSYKIGYTIYDDEPTDIISQLWGIDEIFGTYIFRTNQFTCETSNPLEYKTYDYIAPIIEFPNIELDSSKDGLAPCNDDSPVITIDIFDEGGIQMAYTFFSINDGDNWDSSILSEQLANPGTWQGRIPAHDHGTTVLWYIKAWDMQGLYSNRTDPNGNPYNYTVINRIPTINLNFPNGNESLENSILIEWTASDPDNDDLTYTVAYSCGGIGWWLIDTGITETSYVWDISNMEYSNSILIKVIVEDGFNGQAEDESDFLFTIGEPSSGGQTIQVSGGGDDDNDSVESSNNSQLFFTILGVSSAIGIGILTSIIIKKREMFTRHS